MFERLRSAFHSWRNWRTEHDAAWAPYLAQLDDGRTRFQDETERRLVRILMLRGLSLVGRRLDGHPPSERNSDDGTLAIHAVIPELDADVWIYDDQAEITTPGRSMNLERWGVSSPAEHFAIVEEFLTELLDASDAV